MGFLTRWNDIHLHLLYLHLNLSYSLHTMIRVYPIAHIENSFYWLTNCYIVCNAKEPAHEFSKMVGILSRPAPFFKQIFKSACWISSKENSNPPKLTCLHVTKKLMYFEGRIICNVHIFLGWPSFRVWLVFHIRPDMKISHNKFYMYRIYMCTYHIWPDRITYIEKKKN